MSTDLIVALRIVDKQWKHPQLHHTENTLMLMSHVQGPLGYHLLLQPSIPLSLCYNHLTNGLELLMKTGWKCVWGVGWGGPEAQECFYGIWASWRYSPASSQHLLPSHQTPALLYHGPPCSKAFSWFQVTLAKAPSEARLALLLSNPFPSLHSIWHEFQAICYSCIKEWYHMLA